MLQKKGLRTYYCSDLLAGREKTIVAQSSKRAALEYAKTHSCGIVVVHTGPRRGTDVYGVDELLSDAG